MCILIQGIVVKVLHKRLGQRFYKKKGVVQEVKDLYTGIVRMLDTGDKIKIDQTHLETVLPAIGTYVVHVQIVMWLSMLCFHTHTAIYILVYIILFPFISGKPVMIVNGAYRGPRAIMEGLDAEHFCVSVRIDQGTARG